MGKMYNVSASPHIRSGVTTSTIMRDVAIALMPACALGVYQFGLRALLILLVSTLTCAATEYIYLKLAKKQQGPYECSAIVTGMLIGMNMPPTVPLWIPVIGGVFAILVVKQVFGGLGQNFMNPALGARCFLFLCYAERMNTFQIPQKVGTAIINFGAASVDGISGATPLAAMKAGETVSLFDAFFGFTGGVIGETSAAMILLGAAYMVYRKVISLRIPVAYLLSFAVFLVLFGGKGFDPYYVACQLCTGGLMLGAFFMATDYVTSPITKNGQIVFGILLGILTGIFRIYGNNAEGVSYAIIIANLLVPLIEKVTMPRPFGKGGH
ncbi:MAG: RnfABCDGE type electron transport complex subunit D [Lachnospiraceae bacterium]|nr:RnfABCDGE type electron transport complex subunit D [Lachnospiraceae bacterium]